MSEETNVDKNYKEAFNLGYELAKELNLKSPMFKDINADDNRMNAMQAGMQQYSNDIVVEKNNENTFNLDNSISIPTEHKDKGKGFDLII